MQVTAQPGELLYYPAYWWHQTKCLDTPTIGVTGLMVGVEVRDTLTTHYNVPRDRAHGRGGGGHCPGCCSCCCSCDYSGYYYNLA